MQLVLTAICFLLHLYKHQTFLGGGKEGVLVLSDKCDMRTELHRFAFTAVCSSWDVCVCISIYIYIGKMSLHSH